MQSPVDPIRIIGRNSVVRTTTGEVSGTIVAAGVKGVSVSVQRQVVNIAPSSVLSITTA